MFHAYLYIHIRICMTLFSSVLISNTCTFPPFFTLFVCPSSPFTSGPKIPFRLGRTDATSGETSPKECGLPDADKGSRKNTIQHVRDVFYRKFVAECCVSFSLYVVSYIFHNDWHCN
jgi:hypothetical protein